ncbi:MAG: carboxypeptidase regulatory-like domain-containing protein [Clostridiales bacterium]|nr:carboxypeptidase regulatory-like domain-containing protein [Clostridiales bacterium]
MSKIKRIISVTLSILLILSLVPVVAMAETSYDEYLTYTISNGEAVIYGCDTAISGAYAVPGTLDGYSVTSIGSRAFYGCIYLTSITIPAAVTSIGSNAFEGCDDNLIIYGYDGTAAEEYANENGITFISLGEYTETEEPLAYTLCDVNDDGDITASDARLALRAAAKLETLTSVQILAADVIPDGKVNPADARLILRITARLIETGSLSGTAWLCGEESTDPIAGATVSIYQNGSLYVALTTDENGEYSVPLLPADTYELVFSLEGCSDYCLNDIEVYGDQLTEADGYLLDEGTITGTVVEASKGGVLSDVTVTIALDSENPVTLISGSDGTFSQSVESLGTYTVTFEKDGYESVTVQAALTNSSHADVGTVSMVKSSDEDLTGGVYAYATSVISFEPGDPWTSIESAMDPAEILGVPDYIDDLYAVTLGAGGVITLGFDVELCDGEGIDIYVYETGGAVEPTLVEVSNDLVNWIEVGTAEGALSGVDINGMVPEGATYKYVRLTDLKSATTGSWPGADVDAVALVHYK